MRSGLDPRKNEGKERRHQIPGLHTSPYLKLYILRADDKEIYKSTERQKIREWIRENAALSTKRAKGRSENHEAFEWLIIHVVIPDTIASSEPRWRESSKDPEELKERKTGMKLPGKSTRTVFDKLRADFNESGKIGQDRVAQIRLTRAQVSADLLPTPAMATTIEETNEEREKSWEDLMIRVRNMTLSMFDTRVRQYETDVAEQEARRAMPGFNFCTFFIYKEGLAMAFESVGLIEDALVIYDELSLGFETSLKGIAGGQADGSATMFAPFTTDIIDRVVGSKQRKTNGVSPDMRNGPEGMEAFQKDYREKIVRSDISVFDFSCYLFARQNALILRLANAKSSRFGSRSSQQDANEDLVLISEVCWRAANFIHNAARSLREDLYAHRTSQWEKEVASPISEADVESLMASWTYIVAGQMLYETYSPALETMNEPGRRELSINGSLSGPKHAAAATLGGVNAYPARTTSLPARKSRTSELQGRDSLQSASDSDLMSPPMSPGSDGPRSTGPTPGLIELVTYRGELLIMQRKMLEQLAKQRQWVAGWALMEEGKREAMETVDLNEDAETLGPAVPPKTDGRVSSLVTHTLDRALSSQQAFYEMYESLSNKAMRLYLAATQSKRAESIMGDLAILKYQQGDYTYAASYFQHVLPFYAEEGWSLMEIEALRMYSMCLKDLGRKEEYVNTLLALVAKACGWRQAQDLSSVRAPTFDEMADVGGILEEAMAASKDLDLDVSNPAGLYFNGIHLEQEVTHSSERDGFSLRLQLRHLLDDEVRIDQIRAKLIQIEDPALEVWLSADEVVLKRGMNHVLLTTPQSSWGAFRVQTIEFQTDKILMVHDPAGETGTAANAELTGRQSEAPGEDRTRNWIFVYPHQQSFHADMMLAKDLQINKSRHVEIHLGSGWNNVESIDLKLRPASAGLRLHLADSSCDGIAKRSEEDNRQGQISIAALGANATACVTVPYTLESASQEILIRLEAVYTTKCGTFTFLTSAKLDTRLHLDVSVNDIFQTGLLSSVFTLRAKRQTPLLVTGVVFDSSGAYEVDDTSALGLPLPIFEHQPAKLLYRVRKKAQNGPTQVRSAGSPLMMSLEYVAIDEILLRSVMQSFGPALNASPVKPLRNLLVPFFERRCGQLLSTVDAEMSLFLNEAKIPSFNNVGWIELIDSLSSTARGDVDEWLKSWHRENLDIVFDIDVLPPELIRTLKIPVEIPSVDFVHDVALQLCQAGDRNLVESTIYTLGESVNAVLGITSTTTWAKKAAIQPHNSTSAESSHTFVYDIHSDPDSWLVGGQKRGHFEAADESKHTFEIQLVPLKLGPLTLPSVDIHGAQGRPKEGEDASYPATEVHWETNYQSAGEVVRIVRPLYRTEVFIPEASGDGRPSSRPSTANSAKEGG